MDTAFCNPDTKGVSFSSKGLCLQTLEEQCSVCIRGLRKAMCCSRHWQEWYHFSRESQIFLLLLFSQAFSWLDESQGGAWWWVGSVLTELQIQMLISKTTFPSTLRRISDWNLWSRRPRKLTHRMLQVRITQSIHILHHAATLLLCISYPRLASTSLCSPGWF